MRADIETYLKATSEASAKRISERIGMPHLDVAKELNRMHADGVVEREKRKGGGNEYVYWLARVDASPAAVRAPDAPAVSPKHATDVAAAETVAQSTGDLSATAAESEDRRGELEDLSARFQELLEVLGLPPTITQAIAAARDMKAIALRTAAERDELKAECGRLKEASVAFEATVARLRENNAALERRIDDLTLGKPGESSPLFVTVGRYAKAMRHTSIEKAQRRAGALIRSEKESEVLVCEPVGRMVRGSEWRSR